MRVSGALHTGWPSTDEYEREQVVFMLPTLPLGFFDAINYAVADTEGLSQTFEIYGVLLDAGSAEKGCPATGGEDQVVVGERGLDPS